MAKRYQRVKPREISRVNNPSDFERLKNSEAFRLKSGIGAPTWESFPKEHPPSVKVAHEQFFSVIKALQSAHVGLLKQKPNPLEERVRQLEMKVAQLQTEPTAPKLGGFDKWLMSEEAKEHAGKHVAWLPGVGVLAISATAGALLDKLEGNPKGEQASIAIVPTWQVVKA